MVLSEQTPIGLDALTLSRYIKSCVTFEQLNVCDNILWNFRRKYKGASEIKIMLFGDIYLSWFSSLVAQYESKVNELNLQVKDLKGDMTIKYYGPEHAGSGQYGICGKCKKRPTLEGHDGCLGTLPSPYIMSACCGHGNDNAAYIQYYSRVIIRGKEAIQEINKLIGKNNEVQ